MKNMPCLKLLKLMNMNYTSYGIKKNMITPNWMKIDIKANVIYIEGIPRYSDIGKLLIRCINIDGYIIM